MKKKRGKKSNRGRKPNRAVRSGIKPDLETLPEVINRIIYGSPQWPMVAMRQSIKNSLQLKDNPFWNRLCAEFERAVLNGDDAAAADWFRRQANAIEKGGSPQRAQFNAKVVYLFGHSLWEILGRPENWRPLTDAERKAFPNLPPRVPHVVGLTPAGKFTDVVMLTPAGKFTDQTASDIYDALEKHPWRTLVDGRWIEDKRQVVVEGWRFDSKERVMEAIHDLATDLQFALKKQR